MTSFSTNQNAHISIITWAIILIIITTNFRKLWLHSIRKNNIVPISVVFTLSVNNIAQFERNLLGGHGWKRLRKEKREFSILISRENFQFVKKTDWLKNKKNKWNCDLDKVKMSEEVLLSQILRKRFSKFPNGSQTHDHPEYWLEHSNHWVLMCYITSI